MSWVFLLTGLVGLALGCVFRLPALLAALLVVTAVAALEFLRGNCSVWCGIALLTTLQVAYFLGVAMATAYASRTMRRRHTKN